MLNWLIRNRLAAFERKFNYDISYAREILATDRSAFFAFAKLQPIGNYRKDIPKDVYWAARLVAVVSEDCGPCTQLVVGLAIADGANPNVLASVLAGDDATLPADARLGVQFARATLAHDIAADEFRDEIVKKWGKRALVALAFGISSARIYPTVKYALGYGKACSRVVVAGEPIAVARDRVTAVSAPA